MQKRGRLLQQGDHLWVLQQGDHLRELWMKLKRSLSDFHFKRSAYGHFFCFVDRHSDTFYRELFHDFSFLLIAYCLLMLFEFMLVYLFLISTKKFVIPCFCDIYETPLWNHFVYSIISVTDISHLLLLLKSIQPHHSLQQQLQVEILVFV